MEIKQIDERIINAKDYREKLRLLLIEDDYITHADLDKMYISVLVDTILDNRSEGDPATKEALSRELVERIYNDDDFDENVLFLVDSIITNYLED